MGIISDTHGLLRPEVPEVFRDAELIIHAGDVGSAPVLREIERMAPVAAVRGNTDVELRVHDHLPETRVVQVGDVFFYVLHERAKLDLDPSAAGFSVVISGHSHMPAVQWTKGVWYLNPGSAGPRRFRLPISVALMKVAGKTFTFEIVELPA